MKGAFTTGCHNRYRIPRIKDDNHTIEDNEEIGKDLSIVKTSQIFTLIFAMNLQI